MLDKVDSSIINSGETEEEPGGRTMLRGRESSWFSQLSSSATMEYEKKYPEARR